MINLITDLISFTQPTNLDKESLSVIESISKLKNKANECILEFNKLEEKNNKDFNDLIISNNKFKEEFKALIEDIENFNVSLKYINSQSQYVQELAKQNQDKIDSGDISSKQDIKLINLSLKNKVEKTDVDNELNKINSSLNLKANKNDIDTINSRIDSFTSLENGSTTGDAELIDIRTGTDGTVYSNAGTSVREQIGSIKTNLYNSIIYNTNTPIYEMGSIGDNGENTTSSTNVRSYNYIYCKKGSKISVKNGYTIEVFKYSRVASGFIEHTRELINYTLDKDCYIRIVFRGENVNIETAKNNILLDLISTTPKSEIENINKSLKEYLDFKKRFNFTSAALIDGQNVYSTEYSPNSRISSLNYITTDSPIIISLNDYSKYKYGIYYTKNGTSYINTGWLQKDYFISENTTFKIVVGLNNPDESMNYFDELYNALNIKSCYNLSFVKQLADNNPRRELLSWEQGTVNSSGDIKSDTRMRSDFIYLNKGDIVYSNNPYCWFNIYKYDLAKNYINIPFSWDNPCDNGSSGNIVLKYVADSEQYVRIVARSKDNIIMNNNAIEEYRHYIVVCNEKGEKQYKYQKLEINGINVVLHRGFSAVAPENTLPSFREGVRRGFKEMETDIWFTKDNVPVICHDPSIDRTSSGTGTIANMTLSQLKEFDFGSWKNKEYTGTEIPTLEELIIDARKYGYKLNLEPKENWTIEQATIVVNLIKKYDMQNNIAFNGYNGYALQHIHDLCDSINLRRSVTEITEDTINATLSLKSDNNNVKIIINASNLTDDMLNLAKEKNVPVHVYFANNIATYEGYSEKYISETTTDYLNPTEYYFS